jgi:nucleoporin GLE1
MHTASSFGSSWISSSPSRNSPNRKSPARNGVRTPGRDVARRATVDKESPSQRLVLEFSQLLIRSDQEFNDRLDEATAAHARRHSEQLNKAALEHERIRQGAERECQRLILEQELERRKQEEEQQREIERVQREKAKQEADMRQRQLEAKQRQEEAARQEAEQKRQIQEAEARAKAQKEQEEALRQQKIQQEQAARKAQEAAAAAAAAERARIQASQQPSQVSQISAASTSASAVAAPQLEKSVSGATDVEKLHSRYLELHQRMKQFWKPFKKAAAEKGNPMKGPVGDMRRSLTQAAGQVTVKREDSKAVITKLRGILRQARDAGGPTIDIRPFIISYPIPPLANESEAQYPAILLYAFIWFEKLLIKQFDKEAPNEDGRIIQEAGAIAGSLFVDKEFLWKGIPMIDLLLAKYHKCCPILFGIRGDKRTAQGAARLGYVKISGVVPSVNEYHQRQEGLAAGFAAISLRLVPLPAIPASEYWRAITSICNIPSRDLYDGHFLVLKGLVKDYGKKFISMYGVQAKAVLRKALIDLPARAPEETKSTAPLVSVLAATWKKNGVLVLE